AGAARSFAAAPRRILLTVWREEPLRPARYHPPARGRGRTWVRSCRSPGVLIASELADLSSSDTRKFSNSNSQLSPRTPARPAWVMGGPPTLPLSVAVTRRCPSTHSAIATEPSGWL